MKNHFQIQSYFDKIKFHYETLTDVHFYRVNSLENDHEFTILFKPKVAEKKVNTYDLSRSTWSSLVPRVKLLLEWTQTKVSCSSKSVMNIVLYVLTTTDVYTESPFCRRIKNIGLMSIHVLQDHAEFVSMCTVYEIILSFYIYLQIFSLQ